MSEISILREEAIHRRVRVSNVSVLELVPSESGHMHFKEELFDTQIAVLSGTLTHEGFSGGSVVLKSSRGHFEVVRSFILD